MDMKILRISDEAYLRLKELQRSRESFSEVIVRMSSGPNARTTLIRRLSFVLWGYCFAVWLYVVVFQFTSPDSIYDVLVWWLPIRMDYIGEAGFILSFVFALTAVYYSVAEH